MKLWLVNRSVQHFMTKIMGKIANCRQKYVKNGFISVFCSLYKVDMQEAVQTDQYAYLDFNDFFTRAINLNLRPKPNNQYAITSPADGSISQLGAIQEGRIIQAKQFDYHVQDLLGGDKTYEPFMQGQFITIYLAPHNYHRVHMPFSGVLKEMIYIPGKLFSVCDKVAESIPNVFAQNERVVCLFETEKGPMAVILIGALIVGSIETVWHGTVTSPRGKSISRWNYENPIKLAQGDELGRFKLGSTVIVLFGPQQMRWDELWAAKMPVKLNQKLGECLHD